MIESQARGGGGSKEFEITDIKLWNKPILNKPKVTVDPSASSKVLEITVGNCAKYKVMARLNGKDYTYDTVAGSAEIEIDEIPTEEKTLSILLSADGFTEKAINVKVKMDIASAPDLAVYFHVEDEGGRDVEITEDDQPVSTEKTSGTLKISSPKVPMVSLTIDGTPVTLTDANNKNVTKKFENLEKGQKTVEVAITYKYFKAENKRFKITKFNPGESPLGLVSAKVFYGDRSAKSERLRFDSQNKAEVTLGEIRFSSVKLEMEFDRPLDKREVTSCNCGRSDSYGKDSREQGDFNDGRFAGYVISDVNPGTMEKKELTPISGRKYTEELVVGGDFAEFKIKVTSKSNSKTAEYTVKIINSNKVHATLGKDGRFKFGIFNGWARLTNFYGSKTQFMLPQYNKGPNFSNNNLNPEGFTDFAYVDKLFLICQETSTPPAPFIFYYNIFEEKKDKHEFMRMYAGQSQNGKAALALPRLDLDQKCLDACVAFKDTLPRGLFVLFYGEKFRKIQKPIYNYRLELENGVKCGWDTESGLPASLIFSYAFNYRRQSMYYEANNKNGTEKALPIGMYQKVTDWEIGGDNVPSGWLPFLSSDGTDVFTFSPTIMDKKPEEVIESVKYTIQTKKDNSAGSGTDEYEEVADFKDKEPSKDSEGGYVLGTIKDDSSKKHKFEKDKIYKVVVTVKYKNQTNNEEKFTYLIDYKATDENKCEGPELLNVGGLYDRDSSLFGVPIHFSDMQITGVERVEKFDPNTLVPMF